MLLQMNGLSDKLAQKNQILVKQLLQKSNYFVFVAEDMNVEQIYINVYTAHYLYNIDGKNSNNESQVIAVVNNSKDNTLLYVINIQEI